MPIYARRRLSSLHNGRLPGDRAAGFAGRSERRRQLSPARWVSSATAIDRGDDPGLVRAWAILRVIVIVAICIGGPFFKTRSSDTKVWLIIVAAGWLPLSIVLRTARAANWSWLPVR